MNTLLISHRLHAAKGADLVAHCSREGLPVKAVVLPPDPAGRLADTECARIEAAFFSSDVFPDHSRQFFATLRKAPALKWLHVFNVGVDHPIYTEMLERGVRLTSSAGTTAAPIAQTAIAGLLMLARGFPRWLAAQRDHRWEAYRGVTMPRDLAGQSAIVVGLGSIGGEIARLGRLLGLKIIGVRRGPRRPDDVVDELHPPGALATLLPRADWLVLACPLTPETRGWITADLLARLPPGARLINVARGEIVDEAALVAALRAGHIAGAYLDVFAHEPLPPDSPLWNLPDVIVTPHNAGVAEGNAGRVYALFRDNLRRWCRGEPLANEVRAQ